MSVWTQYTMPPKKHNFSEVAFLLGKSVLGIQSEFLLRLSVIVPEPIFG